MLGAISIGVWAMIFMTALMRGMVDDMLNQGIRNLPGHIQIQHPDFLDSLKRRGIKSAEQVSIEGYAIANFAAPEEKHKRLTQAHCFFVENPGDNPHVRPIEGLVPVVDLTSMTVLRIQDSGVVSLPPDTGEYRAERLESVREPLAPLEITQPNGADFQVDGHAVSWQNWRFRVGFTPKVTSLS